MRHLHGFPHSKPASVSCGLWDPSRRPLALAPRRLQPPPPGQAAKQPRCAQPPPHRDRLAARWPLRGSSRAPGAGTRGLAGGRHARPPRSALCPGCCSPRGAARRPAHVPYDPGCSPDPGHNSRAALWPRGPTGHQAAHRGSGLGGSRERGAGARSESNSCTPRCALGPAGAAPRVTCQEPAPRTHLPPRRRNSGLAAPARPQPARGGAARAPPPARSPRAAPPAAPGAPRAAAHTHASARLPPPAIGCLSRHFDVPLRLIGGRAADAGLEAGKGV